MPEHPAWPRFFTPAEDLRAWLQQVSQQHPGDTAVQRHVLTLRWLLLAELDRAAPPPASPKPPPRARGTA